MCVEESSMWSLAWSSINASKTSWTFGLPFATGIIEFETLINKRICSKASKDYDIAEDTGAARFPTRRVKIALPHWLSCKVLEVMACQAQVGWKQYLRVRNIFPDPYRNPLSKPFMTAMMNIRSGNFNQLRSQFQTRVLTPWDEDTGGNTLLTVGAPSLFISFLNLLLKITEMFDLISWQPRSVNGKFATT